MWGLLAVRFVGILALLTIITQGDLSHAAETKSSLYAVHADDEELSSSMVAAIKTLEALNVLFIFAIAASIGSFLNVVIYRVPRHLPLVRANSACPQCGHKLSSKDNMPILGWLRLKGRCRYCSARIPFRYLGMELAIGGIFMLLLFVELLSGGVNLPVRIPNHYAGFLWVVWYTKWDLVGIYLYHCLGLSMLLVVAMMQHDRQTVPLKMFVYTFLPAALLPVVWPTLHPWPAMLYPPSIQETAVIWSVNDQWISPGWTLQAGLHLTGFLDSLAGVAVGMICGLLLSRVMSHRCDQAATIYACTFIGLLLGWQTAVMSIAVAAACLITSTLIRRSMLAYSSAILHGVSLVMITGWNQFARLWPV